MEPKRALGPPKRQLVFHMDFVPKHYTTAVSPGQGVGGAVKCIFVLGAVMCQDGFGGLGIACWPLVPKVRGFKPDRSRRIFKGKKILSTPSFGGEVKPSVSCRRFAACKRSLNGVEVVISAKLPDNILAHSSTFRR